VRMALKNSVTDSQRRNRGTRRVRLEGWDLDRNQDLDGRTRYWNCISKDLILRGQEETKV
jgi:hypothetical protein